MMIVGFVYRNKKEKREKVGKMLENKLKK